MSEVISLSKPEVLKLEIKRNTITRYLEAYIEIEDSGSIYFFTLVRPSDIDVLTELFEAESIWVTKNTGSGLEFGIYDLFIMNESTYDTSVDDIIIRVNNVQGT